MTACATFSTVIRFWQGGEMSDRFGAFGAPVPETGPAAQHIAQRVASRRRGILRRTVMTHDITSLDDHETVARWIRHMHEGTSQTVTVNRPWGSVFAISMGRPPAGVMVESGTRLLQGQPNGRGSEFVKKYGIYRLARVEEFASPRDAIAREKQLKNWHRDWKIRLIEEDNPCDWSDLSHLL